MKVIDAFAHVGLPRFVAAEDLLRVMDSNGVEAAIVMGAETCPDVLELSRAATLWPDRFRAVGMALGKDPDDVQNRVKAQLDSGFIGIRLSAEQINQQPRLLELIGQSNATPFVFGPDLFGAAARHLLLFLQQFPDAHVCAPHFAGIAYLDVFESDDYPHARAFLNHPRFLVICSRQGAYDPTLIPGIAKFLVREIGWDRLLWGSEYPVTAWRDESYQSTIDWIDTIGLHPTDGARRAFLQGNARKLFFSEKSAAPTRLDLSQDQMPFRKSQPVWLFPRDTIDLPEEIHRTLLLNYLARGGDQSMRYTHFIATLLTDAARRMEG